MLYITSKQRTSQVWGAGSTSTYRSALDDFSMWNCSMLLSSSRNLSEDFSVKFEERSVTNTVAYRTRCLSVFNFAHMEIEALSHEKHISWRRVRIPQDRLRAPKCRPENYCRTCSMSFGRSNSSWLEEPRVLRYRHSHSLTNGHVLAPPSHQKEI